MSIPLLTQEASLAIRTAQVMTVGIVPAAAAAVQAVVGLALFELLKSEI